MRNAGFLLTGLAGLATVTVLLVSGSTAASPSGTASARTSQASSPGVVDLVAIDALPYHCAANTATSIDHIDQQLAFWSIGESAEIDIVVDEVDPADGLSGFGADLRYNPAIIEVTAYDDEFLLDAAGPRIPTTTTEWLPGDFRFDSGDLSTNFEDGEGVLARITVTCMAAGMGFLSLDDVAGGDGVPDILDAGGDPLPVGTIGGDIWIACGTFLPTYRDFEIVEETVVGPEVINGGSGDYVIETTVKNDGNWYEMDGLITTEIMPPPECDVGAGPGNLHTIATPVLAVAECTEQAVDVPFQVQCSAPGVHDFDLQITSEIRPEPFSCGYCPPDPDPNDNMVSHEEAPGALPPLALIRSDSPGPALRVTAWNCPAGTPWSVPVGDSDCDGWTDGDEGLIGSDPVDACPDSPADDAWPCDFDMNAVVNVSDVFKVLPPYFGRTNAHPEWDPRQDLVPNGVINISDVFKVLPPYFGYVCTP